MRSGGEAPVEPGDQPRPISESKPSGESLRYAGTYDAILQARHADDNLNQGEWKREAKVADWATVTKIASEALAFKTKDIQVAAWLTEALAKQHGFAGLRDGLECLGELQRHFWETLFPEPEDGDLDVRSSVIEWLNDKLAIAVREIAITQPIDNAAAYSLLRYQESRTVDELGRRNREAMQAAIGEGKITVEQFDKAVGAGSRNFYEGLFVDIRQSIKQCEKLAEVVDEKFGPDAPGLMGVRKALQDCADLVEGVVKKKRELEPDPAATETSVNGNGSNYEDLEARDERAGHQVQTKLRPQASSEVTDRAEALRQLQVIAEYFHRTEPHSPVSYLVQRAVRWGQMPLEKWLTDVISDQGVLTRVRETLGIKDS